MMHPLRPETLHLLQQLVAFDTTSAYSNLALIDWAEEYLRNYGAVCHRIYNDEHTKAGLIATIGPDAPGGIVLSGHTDVVPVIDQPWETPPFTVIELDDKLYGRGTADMKGFLACCMAMAPGWSTANLTRPYHLVFSYDEEIGCLGAPPLVEEIKRLGLAPALAVIGEPTMMRVVNAHKGIRTFVTEVTGLEAHSSRQDEGLNAILIAAELIQLLHTMREELRGTLDTRFEPPFTTFNVGTIEGGTANNIIPRSCRFVWEFRPIPGVDADALLQRFLDHANALQARQRPQFPTCSITTTVRSSSPDLAPDDASTALVNTIMHCAGTNTLEAVSFCTEAGIFCRGGIPAVVCGPGDIAQAHKPNEWIELSQIDACLSFLEKLSATV